MATGALPPVPPGQNPWTVYIGTLDDAFYTRPPPGFKPRLIGVISLTASTILLAVIYVGLLVRDGLKRNADTGRRKGIWFFRLVERANGSYVITNTKLAAGLCTFLCGAVALGFASDIWRVYLQGASQSSFIKWQNIYFIPVLIQGWLITWGSLQAFLLSTDHHHRQMLSPRIANSLFIGVGTLLLCASVAIATANIIGTGKVLREYTALRNAMSAFERRWQPSDNVLLQLLNLQSQFERLQKEGARTRTLNITQLSVISIIPFFVLGVCINSLRLASIINKQIQFNIRQCRKPFEQTETTYTLQTAADTSTLQWQSEPDQESKYCQMFRSTIGRNHLSRTEMQRLAKRRGSGTEQRERLKHIQALQKAENDLVIINVLVILALSAISGLCLMALVLVVRYPNVTTIPWAGYEALLVGPQWVYAVTLTLVLGGLIFNSWSSRSLVDKETFSFLSLQHHPGVTQSHTATLDAAMRFTSLGRPVDAPPMSQTNSFFRMTVEVMEQSDEQKYDLSLSPRSRQNVELPHVKVDFS